MVERKLTAEEAKARRFKEFRQVFKTSVLGILEAKHSRYVSLNAKVPRLESQIRELKAADEKDWKKVLATAREWSHDKDMALLVRNFGREVTRFGVSEADLK